MGYVTYVRFSTCPHRTDDLMPLRASVPTDYVFRTPRIDRCITVYTLTFKPYTSIYIYTVYTYTCVCHNSEFNLDVDLDTFK